MTYRFIRRRRKNLTSTNQPTDQRAGILYLRGRGGVHDTKIKTREFVFVFESTINNENKG